MIKYFTTLALLLITHTLLAQKIKGKIFVGDNLPVSNASIIFLMPDSTLIKHTRSLPDGSFNLKSNYNGKGTVLITHPLYGDIAKAVDSNATNLDLGVITMKSRSTLLKEIVVRQKGSIKINGDTTVYLADSFKLDDNANVESLLKLLPGISVDANGNITAQGEQVQKVLVDGEEFFGDDPTVATKNLNANIVSKVEVFDSKSEQAKFTGFDDGQKEKTINLKLKNDKNKGVFGKAEAGTNAGQLWNNSGMVNAFKAKRKLSVYAINSSNGKSGLSWKEKQNFAGGGNAVFNDDGDMWTVYKDDEDDGGWQTTNTEGRPKVNNGGAHYSNKWNDGKQHLGLNFTTKNNYNHKTERNSNTQYIGDATVNTITNKDAFAERLSNAFSAKHETTIDSTSTIIFEIDYNNRNSKTTTNTNTNNSRNLNTVSSSKRVATNTSNTDKFGAEITYNKKLKKKGRTISLNTGGQLKNTKGNGTLNGLNNFTSALDVLDQVKNNSEVANNINGKITYTEPLQKDKIQAEISYSLDADFNKANKNSLIKDGSTEYSRRLDSLSNDFTSNVIVHQPSFKIRYNINKIKIGIGTGIAFSQFHQKDDIRLVKYDYNRLRITPQLNFSYKFSQFSSLSINYRGYTNQPTILQIQNLTDNTDPLNITVGNPNLRQGFTQAISGNYWNYKAFSDRSIWAGFWMNNRFNAVQNTQTFEANTGRTINGYANANGYFTLTFWSGRNAKIKNSDWKYNIGLNGQVDRNPGIINNITSYGQSYNADIELGISYNKSKKYNFSVTHTTTGNSYSNKILNQKNNYFSFSDAIDGQYFITKRCVLETDFSFLWQQARPPFSASFSRALWNSSIGYRFLKQKNLEAKLSAFDILNQNNGYTRTANANNLSERNFVTIRRYFMVSLIYNFSFGPINKMKDLVDEDDN